MKTPMLVASMLVAAAAVAAAQQPQSDPRFEAWVGCWKAVDGASNPTGRAPTVCVIPAAGGVDVVTVVDTSVVARDHIDAIAERHAVTREGCSGWETDTWSSQGDRLYRRSEFACPGDVKRSASEVFAMTPEWEWLDVQGLAAHGGIGVRTLRYRSAALPAVPEIAAALATHQSVMSMARAAAATPPTPADVIEASRAAEGAVVEAWLAEEGEGFPLNGKQLEALADSGVPPGVIDVMVALTYPKVFTVAAPSARGGSNPADVGVRRPPPDTTYAYQQPDYGYGMYAPWGWDYYSPWSWSMYGFYSPYYYSPYGAYSPYAYGGYYGGYYGGGTVIVVTGGNGSAQSSPHGQMVKGKGFTGGSGDNTTSRPASTGSSSSSSGSSGSAPATSSPPRSSGSSSGSSSQAGQHAHPKP